MRHLNLELEKLEKRIAPGGIFVPSWGGHEGGDCGSHNSGGSKASNGGSKASNGGSKASNGGSKSCS